MSIPCDKVEMMVTPEDCDNISNNGETCSCIHRIEIIAIPKLEKEMIEEEKEDASDKF